VRIGTGDEFLRSSGGTLTGALTISANADPMLTLHRPDGASARVMDFRLGGTLSYGLSLNPAEPKFAIQDGTFTERLQLNMATGLLGAALIPLSLLRVGESFASNAGIITVLAGNTTIVSAAQITVAIGDRILIGYDCRVLKGAATGVTNLFIQKTAGGGTVLFYNNAGIWAGAGALSENPGHVNATQITRPGFVEARATAAGTVTLSLIGTSAGSNGTVAIGDGQIHVDQVRG
jgi:hypothetical protein